jgi:hypothetical protein
MGEGPQRIASDLSKEFPSTTRNILSRLARWKSGVADHDPGMMTGAHCTTMTGERSASAVSNREPGKIVQLLVNYEKIAEV